MPRTTRFSPEVRERAVRLVQDHRAEYESQWAAIRSIASKLGCSGEALRSWLRRAERAVRAVQCGVESRPRRQ